MQRICQEIRIQLPSGFIAGKWWGPGDKRPILALHGWQDNCGTFDRLIPHLPPHLPVLALDFPGHGHSQRLPPGIPYYNMDGVIMIKMILKYFGWKKVSLMGHSMGARMSYVYGSLFPIDVDFLICLEGFPPIINDKRMDRVARSVEEFVKYNALSNSKDEPPSYTFEEMETRVHLGTMKSTALETAKYILARNIVSSEKHPGKFYFKRDPRLKVGPLENPDPVELVRCGLNITFPVCVCKADDAPFYGSEKHFMDCCASVKQSSKDFQLHRIPGTHHVHLNRPETLERILNDFIKKHDVEDRSGGGLKPEMKVSQNEHLMPENAAKTRCTLFEYRPFLKNFTRILCHARVGSVKGVCETAHQRYTTSNAEVT